MIRSKTLRTSKNAIMLLAGTITRMIASFAFVLYSAKLLGVEEFGKFSLVTHIFELFLSLTATGVGLLLTRDVARWPRNLNPLLTSAVCIVVALCLLSPILMISLGLVFGYSHSVLVAIGISAIALLPAAVCVQFEAVFVARERAEYVTFGTVIESSLRIFLGILVLRIGYGLIELMWVLVFARIVLLIAYWRFLNGFSTPSWKYSSRSTSRYFLRWRVFAAETWMATIYTTLDVLFLSTIAGEAAVGLYSAAWKFVRLGTVVAKSFTTAIFPIMSRLYIDSQDSFHRLYHNTIRIMCAISLPAIIGVSVITDRIVAMLYTEEYAAAGPVLRVLIWVMLVEFLNPFLSHCLYARGKQQRSMLVAAVSLIVNSVATYFLVQRFGAVGAATGCILAGSVATICYLVLSVTVNDLLVITFEVGRIFTAAIGMGIAIHFVRDSSLPIVLLVAIVSYTLLLFIVRALRMTDVRFFKSVFLERAVV